MVILKNNIQLFDNEHFNESLFKLKETDCTLYSDDGIKINIHKEILYHTQFMQNILLSSSNCCRNIEIFCPCSTQELEDLVKFLYSGRISYNTDNDLKKTLDNLNIIFGYSEDLDFDHEQKQNEDSSEDTIIMSDSSETNFNVSKEKSQKSQNNNNSNKNQRDTVIKLRLHTVTK